MEAHNSDFIPKIANYKDFVQCNAEPFWKEHSVHLQNIVIVISTMYIIVSLLKSWDLQSILLQIGSLQKKV